MRRQQYCLQQMGIPVWETRAPVLQADTLPTGNPLAQLCQVVSHCQACSLSKTRSNTVFARGNPAAKLFIVGEAPGYHEDKQARPFVGKAGKLLDNMLRSIGLSEQDVYIANVLKCRPPNNRDPQTEEILACQGYLKSQIALIKPALLLGLGRFAGHFLSQTQQPLNRLRQARYEYEGTPVCISYHPAYLLRNPKDKAKAWWDLQMLMQDFGDQIALPRL